VDNDQNIFLSWLEGKCQMSDSRNRVRRIFSEIEDDETIKEKPKTLILANGVAPHTDSSLFYITGFPYGLFEGSILIAEKNSAISLITSPLEEPIAGVRFQGSGNICGNRTKGD